MERELLIAIIIGFVIYAIIERLIHSVSQRIKNQMIIVDLLRGIAEKLEVDKIYFPKAYQSGYLMRGEANIHNLELIGQSIIANQTTNKK